MNKKIRMQSFSGFKTCLNLTVLQSQTFNIFIITYFFLYLDPISSQCQSKDTTRFVESIAVVGRPSNDSITLRWAPLKLSVWQQGNKDGYTIERYVLARNGKVLSQPEKVILTSSALKPLPENQWEPLVIRDKYAAIAAQALFGERFEIDLTQSDMFTIVNKVRENEQRFSFALFSADMSPSVAKALGLWFTDKNIKKGEKYLYRIIINHSVDSLRGSLFITPDNIYTLPKPQNLNAAFKGLLVSLRWDKGINDKYTAYIIERSSDGKNFTQVSDVPLVTVSPSVFEETRYEYAIDSLPDASKTYYYRVRGLTPFGEVGSPSEIVIGKGNVIVTEVPHITAGDNIDNKSIGIAWAFPEVYNEAIKGFTLERSSKPQGDFKPIHLDMLGRESRSYEDKNPEQVNYYTITAHGLDGAQHRSPLYFSQLVDSIPPSAPVGLKATVNESGTVELFWQPNIEPDIYGYRIYKANVKSEELSQITTEPITRNNYTDRVNLNTLNETVYYSVMAIDRNQNHSSLSELLKVTLPDKLKPQPPVFLPIKNDEKGVLLSWMKSSSDDVVRYEVYRKASDRKEWQRLKMINVSKDSVYQFTDEYSEAGKNSYYTVVAIDDAGLESDPATPVNGLKIDNELRPAVQWKPAVINKEQNQVVLSWGYEYDRVSLFRVYKSIGENPFVLFKSIQGNKKEFVDVLVPGTKYKYRIMAIFENGNKSDLSMEQIVNY